MLSGRRAKFLSLLPKHLYKVYPAAVEAGYSPQYANDHGKQLYNAAMRAYAREMAEINLNKPLPSRQERKTLAELIGLSREEVFEALRNIAVNSKDYTSALKVLKPLSKDLGADLTEGDDTKIVVPVLNIGVRERETALELDNVAQPSDQTDNSYFATLPDPLIEPLNDGLEGEDEGIER